MEPNYNRIYRDVITQKYPDKMGECVMLLNKQQLSIMDILELNKKIFGSSVDDNRSINQRLRSYKKTDILKILDFQKSIN